MDKVKLFFNRCKSRIDDFLYFISCAIHNSFNRLFRKNKKATASLSSSRKKEIIFIVCMLSIPVVHFCIMWIYVNLNSILLAFRRYDPVHGDYYLTFKNFTEGIRLIFNNQSGKLNEGVKNTLITFSFQLFIMFPISFFLTIFIYKKVRWNKFFIVFLFMPGMFSVVALCSLYNYALQSDGLFGWFAKNILHLDRIPALLTETKYANNMLLLYIFLFSLPGNMLLFLGAMNRIPKEMMESAYLDGVGFGREIFNFIIPLTWPTISTLLTFQMCTLFSAGGPVLTLTRGAGGTYTIGYWQYVNVIEQSSYELPSAIGLIFAVIALPIILVVKHFLEKTFEDVQY